MGLTEFVAARLDEDEAAARFMMDREARCLQLRAEFLGFPLGERVLREAGAKRKILALHEQARSHKNGRLLDFCICQAEDGVVCGHWPCETLRALAAVYSDHPDYDPAWKE